MPIPRTEATDKYKGYLPSLPPNRFLYLRLIVVLFLQALAHPSRCGRAPAGRRPDSRGRCGAGSDSACLGRDGWRGCNEGGDTAPAVTAEKARRGTCVRLSLFSNVSWFDRVCSGLFLSSSLSFEIRPGINIAVTFVFVGVQILLECSRHKIRIDVPRFEKVFGLTRQEMSHCTFTSPREDTPSGGHKMERYVILYAVSTTISSASFKVRVPLRLCFRSPSSCFFSF